MKLDISSNATFAAVVHSEFEFEKKVQFRIFFFFVPLASSGLLGRSPLCSKKFQKTVILAF